VVIYQWDFTSKKWGFTQQKNQDLPCSDGELPSKDWDVTEMLNKLMVKLEFLLADKIRLTTSQCVALLSPFSPCCIFTIFCKVLDKL
jgi:hypothetical protein